MTTTNILFAGVGVMIDAEMFSLQYQKEFGVSNDEMLPFFTGDFKDCLIGKADLVEKVTPWLPKWKWAGSVEEFLDFWFKAEHNVDERMTDIVKKLKDKGIRCYLATNQEKYRTQYMKDKMGFENLFHHVFSSADIGAKKPKKEFFQFILNELKNEHRIQPHEIMFFDDTEENIDGAKELDIDAHHFTDYDSFMETIQPLLENSEEKAKNEVER